MREDFLFKNETSEKYFKNTGLQNGKIFNRFDDAYCMFGSISREMTTEIEK